MAEICDEFMRMWRIVGELEGSPVEGGRVDGYCDREHGGTWRWVWSVEGKWGTGDDYLGSDRGMKVCGLGMAEYVGDVQGKNAMSTCSGM